MSYDVETLRSDLKAFISENIGDALDTVEAEFEDTDPITLDEPVTWHEGHNPTVLELYSEDFPFVAIMIADRTPKRGGAEWGYQDFTSMAYIDLFVVADDVATVNKIVHRYVRAIVAILQTKRNVAGYRQRDFEPEVKVSEASRHKKTENADFYNSSDIDFIQAARILVPFEGGT